MVMDSLRYWVDQLSCGRLPLRPRHHAGPGGHRLRSRRRPLRRDAPGPGAGAGEADLPSPGTSAPAATSWAPSRPASPNGTTASATASAASGAAIRGMRAGPRRPAHRLRRPVRPPGAAAPGPASTSLACHDGFTLADTVAYEQQAQRGQRRGQPRRPPREPLAATGAWRARRDDPEIIADPRARPPGAAGHACSPPPARRCCWPATSSATPRHGNNNAYCQDNDISWLDWDARRHAGGRSPHRASSPG